ncbi:hypothetical protein SAMN04488063_1819 [Halopelagius inordinatus]|uniref:Uncharacterized protein n=1 Tax=Halopelagius inordinatus TaxID=553467 RepID=A0A1I2R821_9EURY|nr:hypothetical protein [Halopelagius inordinatus]SFG36638.1 hypothetical protein SAMN04488063_1819 [Halopelagius inordinatus]
MLAVLRAGLRVALNRQRVFGLSVGVLLFEGLVRVALAALHPVLSLLCPPLVSLLALGSAAPTVRTAVVAPEATPDWTVRSTLRERGARLCAVAVSGHLVSLALGAAGFLVVDTALRAVIYAAGGTVPTAVVVLTPFAGVAAGTFVAWGLIAPTVARVVSGTGLGDAATASVRAIGDRRRTSRVLCLHAACVLVAAGAFGVCLVLGSDRYATQEAAVVALLVGVAVTTVTLTILGAFVYPIHVALAAERADETQTVPVRRVALAAVLVAGLVVGAAAIRVTDARPSTGPSASASLPGDATDAYATALDRTASEDHRVVVREVRDGERSVSTTVLERSARRYLTARRSDGRTSVGYADSGVSYNFGGSSGVLPYAASERRVGGGVARALPYYWYVRDEYSLSRGIGYGLPESRTGRWTTVAAENGTRTLELADGPAVFAALYDAPAENGRYETAVIRMRVDTDRGVVVGGRTRLNATVGERRVIRNVSYAVETGDGVDARRPSVLGPRSVGEWTWDLFAY